MIMPFRILAVASLLLLAGCASSRPYVAEPYAGWQDVAPPPDSARAYRVFLLGDAGDPALDPPEPVLRLLKTRLEAAGAEAAVVFLGDNIYEAGLADSGDARRRQDEARLMAQLKTVEKFEGRVVFLPGNHDWNHWRAGGLEAVRRQERFVEDTLRRGNVFLPDDGFPGPVEVELTNRLTLVVLDTQWWLHRHEKPYGDTGDYDLEEDADFLLQLDDVLKRNRKKDLLVTAHHPLFSNGSHAGYLPLRYHLFPLTQLHPALYLPLPLLGSAYPLFVRFFGARQDLAHPRYKALRRALLPVLAGHERLVYAAGHDHNLQHFPVQQQHYLVSGAGSRTSAAAPGRGVAFTYGRKGFAVLDYFRDGAVWLEMWAPEGDGATGRLLFRTRLYGPAPELVDPGVRDGLGGLDYGDSTAVAAANPRYAAGPLKTILLGSHHRDAWAAPVRLQVLDLGRVAGGLTPRQRGGGLQTTSLRLRGGDGHEYVLRSVDKDPSSTVPANLQGTFATDLVQDQIASLHPYGALIIPPLARAAGVYHTNTRAVFVPDDPRLGLYREVFAGKIALFEERPDEDESDVPSFGRARNVVSAFRLYRELDDDNDHRVDQRAFARARLFDMLLADWDRHRDQWRWAAFEPYELDPSLEGEARKEGKIYRPIPRDRDWAFNKMNGLFPSLAGYFDPKFQDFAEHYGYLRGLTLNGLEQDRRLLNALPRPAWIEIADSLRAALTDDVIDEAVRAWPDPLYERGGDETARILKIRRDQLSAVAEQFYEEHARVVDVVGSHKHERFEVTRLDDDSTRVVVYKTSKQGEIRRVIYRRTFLRGETKEIRLYGLDGNDQFVVEGAVRRGLRVVAVGGPGADHFVDRSRVGGWGRQTRFYDTASGNTWEAGPEARLVRSDLDPAVNRYDPNAFQYNLALPLTFFGRNSDDGVFLGGGLQLIRHGFRKTPYAASHRLKANFASRTRAVNAVYAGHFVEIVGGWDVTVEAAYFSPDNIRNFYGLGNETENTERDREFYQARLTQAHVATALQKRLEEGATFRIGPSLSFTDVRADADRFVGQPQAGISPGSLDEQAFAALEAALTLETVDDAVNPKQGFRWTNRAALHLGVFNADDPFGAFASDLAFYLSPSLSPQVTLAARAGGAHHTGQFPFYSANTLGGKDNLRGHRSTRFAGRSSLYQNVELRLELFTFSTYLAVGRAGLLGFFDQGRVWVDGERSKTWHRGYGGGLWFELFRAFVLSGHAGFSDDDRTLDLGLGFQY